MLTLAQKQSALLDYTIACEGRVTGDSPALADAEYTVRAARMMARFIVDGHRHNAESFTESVQLLEECEIEEPVSGDWLAYLRVIRNVAYPAPRLTVVS